MATAQDIIDNVGLEFPGIADPVVLAHLQREHDELSYLFDLGGADETISIQAGIQEYALDADIRRVWSVDYQLSATNGHQLRATHVDKLDDDASGWRFHPNGLPLEFYVERGFIGLYPKPSATTSGTYPRLSLSVSRSVTLVVGTTMPAQIHNFEAWEAGVRYRIARQTADERMMVYLEERKAARTMLSNFIDGRNPRFITTRKSEYSRGGSRRV